MARPISDHDYYQSAILTTIIGQFWPVILGIRGTWQRFTMEDSLAWCWSLLSGEMLPELCGVNVAQQKT